MRKSELTASTLLQCAFASMSLSVEKRLRSRSNAKSYLGGKTFVRRVKRVEPTCTLPLFCMIAQRCDVLFPGAAVASMTNAPSCEGGERM